MRPLVGGIAGPARAIADGTVIFASPPKAANTNVDDAQNYNPFDRQGVKRVAVGTGIAPRPPHRSVRAELPHTAPALSHDAKRSLGYG